MGMARTLGNTKPDVIASEVCSPNQTIEALETKGLKKSDVRVCPIDNVLLTDTATCFVMEKGPEDASASLASVSDFGKVHHTLREYAAVLSQLNVAGTVHGDMKAKNLVYFPSTGASAYSDRVLK